VGFGGGRDELLIVGGGEGDMEGFSGWIWGDGWGWRVFRIAKCKEGPCGRIG
jgi:hypothetical protein